MRKTTNVQANRAGLVVFLRRPPKNGFATDLRDFVDIHHHAAEIKNIRLEYA
jgi:uncharacterized protein YlbG (UPF0298 family)